jgi:DNA topoisomerase I
VESARAARLRYVSDGTDGIRRRRTGSGFTYLDARGAVIRDRDELRRIRALAVPPAWTDVWICPIANGHVQATGRDARGRKQYRYHPRWRATRDETKYGRMIAFGEALPRIRARVEQDLARPGLPREKVLATVVKLMQLTAIRVGNEEYAKANDSFGLTTLRDRHVEVSGDRVHFQFRGKSGKRHAIKVSDRRLARIIKQCQDIPGYELFQYLDDDGERRAIGSADVNDYLREISGDEFTAKDFRTWAGTILAVAALQEIGAAATQTQAKRNLTQAIVKVSEQLGNTPAICRKCYVHPNVLDGYLDGTLLETLTSLTKSAAAVRGLGDEENIVLALLRAAHVEAAEPLAEKLAGSLAR